MVRFHMASCTVSSFGPSGLRNGLSVHAYEPGIPKGGEVEGKRDQGTAIQDQVLSPLPLFGEYMHALAKKQKQETWALKSGTSLVMSFPSLV